jgi:CBS domain-containing protein
LETDALMLQAHDIMNRQVITVPASMTIGDLVDLLQRLNIHAAPVLDEAGQLAGMVTQEDVLYGTMGGDGDPEPQGHIQSRAGLLELRDFDSLAPDSLDLWARPVSDIMTNPPIAVDAESPVREVCRIMWSLRLHHIPVTESGKVVGLISSLDFCRAISEGKIGV